MGNIVGLLNDKQQKLISELAADLKKEQLLWISGYLAGLSSSGTATSSVDMADTGRAIPLTILFGTHTGHSEEIAEQIKYEAEANGFIVEVEVMEDYNRSDLKKVENLLIVVSTHGEGEPPLTALDFLEYLQGDRAPKLNNLNFSVLALGDKSYQKYCQTGIDFQTALLKAGAKEFVPIVLADVDYHEDAEKWRHDVLAFLAKGTGLSSSSASTDIEEVSSIVYNRKNPFRASVIEKIKLSGRDSKKEVYHLELSLEDSELRYEPGDTVGIYASNPVNLVDQVINHLSLNEAEQVQLKDGKTTILEALTSRLEITVLSREVIVKYASISEQPTLLKLADDFDMIEEYVYGHDFLDLLTDFPASINSVQLVEVLRELPARMYSIASSQSAFPEELHITVSAVRYEKNQREHLGVCSTYLIDQINVNDMVGIFIEKNRGFKLPSEKDAAVIMVGAGTGIAPYRSFIQQRQREKATGLNWLVFGDQHFYSDFLYQAEWQKHLQKGILSKINVAFSRDQEEKVYVQHKLKENGAELYEWLQNGASFYVCGDKNHMAKDVHQTLIEIVSSEGGKSLAEAEDYLTTLKKERRYQLDVY